MKLSRHPKERGTEHNSRGGNEAKSWSRALGCPDAGRTSPVAWEDSGIQPAQHPYVFLVWWMLTRWECRYSQGR